MLFSGVFYYSLFHFFPLVQFVLFFLGHSFFLFQCTWVAGERIYAFRILYDGIAWYWLLPPLHYDVVYLCRSFVTTKLESL